MYLKNPQTNYILSRDRPP